MHALGKQLAKLTLVAALVALVPGLARADFDMAVDVAKTSSKAIKMERTGPARGGGARGIEVGLSRHCLSALVGARYARFERS